MAATATNSVDTQIEGFINKILVRIAFDLGDLSQKIILHTNTWPLLFFAWHLVVHIRMSLFWRRHSVVWLSINQISESQKLLSWANKWVSEVKNPKTQTLPSNHILKHFHVCTAKILTNLSADQKENALRNYIGLAAAEHKLDHLKWLYQVIIQLVNANVIAARYFQPRLIHTTYKSHNVPSLMSICFQNGVWTDFIVRSIGLSE